MGDSERDREKNSFHSSDDGEANEDDGVMAEQKGNKPGGGTDGAVGGTEDGVEAIRAFLANRLKLGSDDDQKLPHVLDSVDFEGIVQYIKDGRAKKIITMAGAGISTSAGFDYGLLTSPIPHISGRELDLSQSSTKNHFRYSGLSYPRHRTIW